MEVIFDEISLLEKMTMGCRPLSDILNSVIPIRSILKKNTFSFGSHLEGTFVMNRH